MPIATATRMTARLRNGSSVTSLRAMTMISEERMKSVRIAPETIFFSSSGPCSTTGASFAPSWWPPTPSHSSTLCAPS